MALVHADRVKQTSLTTGTGTYALEATVPTGFQGFVAGIGNGNTCYYVATDGTNWEVGLGTVTDASPDTLARTTILASSNAGAAVNWGVGTRTLFCGIPASKFTSLNDLLTTRGDLLRKGASAVERVALGTSGQVLGSDGTDALWINHGLRLISTQVASASATIDFTGLDNTYDNYVIEIAGIRPANDQVEFWMRVQTGGSTWQAGAGAYNYTGYVFNASIIAVESASDTKILMTRGAGTTAVDNATQHVGDWTIKFSMPATTAHKHRIRYQGGYRRADENSDVLCHGYGYYDTAGAITGIRFQYSGGDIAEGRFSLYGMVQ